MCMRMHDGAHSEVVASHDLGDARGLTARIDDHSVLGIATS